MQFTICLRSVQQTLPESVASLSVHETAQPDRESIVLLVLDEYGSNQEICSMAHIFYVTYQQLAAHLEQNYHIVPTKELQQ